MTTASFKPILALACLGALACPGDDGSSNETSTTTTTETSTTATSTATSVADTTHGDPSGCEPSTPILQADGTPTGFVRCQDGAFERVEAVACSNPTPLGACMDAGVDSSCTTDAECTASPYGVCVGVTGGAGGTICSCAYGCVTDADCPDARICACGGDADGYPGGTACIPAPCSFNDDCGEERCHMATSPDGCELSPRMACTTAEDLCQSHDDCDRSNSEACLPSAGGRWQCFLDGCA